MTRQGTITISARCWLCHGDWRVEKTELDPDKGLVLHLRCEECPNPAWMRVEVFDKPLSGPQRPQVPEVQESML